MSSQDSSPHLVVVAHPRKARYSRHKQRPVHDEDSGPNTHDDDVEDGEEPAKAAG